MNDTSPPLISVIIPTLNEEDCIRAAILSIGKLGSDIECLVVDGGSHDRTLEFVRLSPDVKLISVDIPGRGKQMNIGACSAKGEILIFLHADCTLPRHAITLVRNALFTGRVVGGSFYLAFTRRHWVLNLCSLCSRIRHPLLTYGDQAQFMRRNVFQDIGGFKELPLMEDLEIQYRLRKRGHLVKINRPVVTSDRRYRRLGPLRHQLFNMWLVALYLAGVSPERLAKWYKPRSPTG